MSKTKRFRLDSKRLKTVISLDHKNDGLTEEEIAHRVRLLYDLSYSSVAKALKDGLANGTFTKKNYKYTVANRSRSIPNNRLCGTTGKKVVQEEKHDSQKSAVEQKVRKQDSSKREACKRTGRSRRKAPRKKDSTKSDDERNDVEKDKKKRRTKRKETRTNKKAKSYDEECEVVKGKRKRSDSRKSKKTKKVKYTC